MGVLTEGGRRCRLLRQLRLGRLRLRRLRLSRLAPCGLHRRVPKGIACWEGAAGPCPELQGRELVQKELGQRRAQQRWPAWLPKPNHRFGVVPACSQARWGGLSPFLIPGSHQYALPHNTAKILLC